MKIFNLNPKERWARVENEMYYIWVGDQKGAILPKWQDIDFKNCMNNLKKIHTLKECEKILNL